MECGQSGLARGADGSLRCNQCGATFVRHSHRDIPIFVSSRSPLKAEEILCWKVQPQNVDLKAAQRHWKTGRMEELLKEPPGRKLLNFGSGDGGDRKWLEAAGFQVTSFDIFPGDFTDFICDGHELPFADEQFDVVTSVAVFEHLYDPFQAAREMFRVLKKGGVLIGSLAFLEPYHARSYFHMSPLGLREVLQRTGFREIEIRPGWSFIESLKGSFWLWNRVPAIRRFTGIWHRLSYRIGLGIWRAAYRMKGKKTPDDLVVTFAGSLIFCARKAQ
ncbi:MAG: methyltransferase domain-containing protein [bacterium]|nr:methyltransferase domain-containing protein [bacterium]